MHTNASTHLPAHSHPLTGRHLPDDESLFAVAREDDRAVFTADLAPILQAWLDAKREGEWCSEAELARRTAIHGNEVGVRQIRKILTCEHPKTRWHKADALLTVIDRSEALRNGEIRLTVIDRNANRHHRRPPIARQRTRKPVVLAAR